MARAVGPAGLVWGIDPFAFNVARGRELAAQERLYNIAFEVADAVSTGISTDFADLCVATYFLGKVARPEAVLAEMIRVARPGGAVVIYDVDDALTLFDPEPPLLAELRRLLADKARATGENPTIGRTLYRLLAAAGLESVRVTVRTTVTAGREQTPGDARMKHISAMVRAVGGLVEKGDLTREEASRYLRIVDEATTHPHGFFLTCDFVVSGRKPLRCA